MEVQFDSLNPYNEINEITAKTPEELVALVRSIRQPIKIISIVAGSNRYTAFFVGDVKIKRKKGV